MGPFHFSVLRLPHGFHRGWKAGEGECGRQRKLSTKQKEMEEEALEGAETSVRAGAAGQLAFGSVEADPR